MGSEFELTILMPCLNEAETIVQCIEKAKSFLIRENVHGEILISDNGSTDGSQALAEKHGASVIHVPVRGYGAALIAGIHAAKGKYIIMGDADDSYDFINLSPFLEKLRSGYELVMGNRFKGGIQPGAMPFLNKYLGNPVLSFIGRLFFNVPIGDFHCGLRGFNRDSMRRIQLQAPGMEFASEMVIKSALKQLKTTEVPTTLAPDGRSRLPHLRKWRDGWRHLRLMLMFSPRWLFLYPGIFLAALGLLLISILSVTPLKIGPYALDIHSLLFAGAFLVIGLQSIFFYIVGRIIGSASMGIPLRKKMDRLLEKFTLEKGIILGFILALLGVGGSLLSVYLWMKAQFGSLVPGEMMRIAIPSVTLMIVGSQIIFASFFLNLVMQSYSDPQKR
ncbi:Undecaprenyl-phosphate 4-deoxy-4-formamido-L-arabinose transferase [Aquicella siphonis]|uniref:Undecaprenyl-phosphate 4-deoxy-4-formamido-L-arabinose transferase n=1 Tax=Aquicella siphonis TaxID=254247 RepID=A0A5E4PJ92_9COXI|nr:glycosyltransferase family 2 protein [Aquicella siphonis]VVC76493.1 Undecaprenyl-phosphate 4-deoxy-4-formamido-L-arabinose transferase [Aquicella siphonis]